MSANQRNKFINDIVKPWGELNELLTQNYAVEPGLSSLSSMAGNVATAIKHQVDALAHDRKDASRGAIKRIQEEVNRESLAAQLISDIGDKVKHVRLSDVAREHQMEIASAFEHRNNQFSFVRNEVLVQHRSLGRFDFMEQSLRAINYWNAKRGLALTWTGSVMEAAPFFQDYAFLRFNPKYVVEVKNCRLLFYQRNESEELVIRSPPEVRFAVVDDDQKTSQKLASEISELKAMQASAHEDHHRVIRKVNLPVGEWMEAPTGAAPPVASALSLAFFSENGFIKGLVRTKGHVKTISFDTKINGKLPLSVPNAWRKAGDSQSAIAVQFIALEKTSPLANLSIYVAGWLDERR